MTLPAGLFEAAARAAVLAVVLAGLAPAAVRAAAARSWCRLALLLPVLTPSVVVGYTYVGWSPGTPGSVALELLYGGLLAGKLLPFAALVQWVLPPPPLDRRARHLLGLAGAGTVRERLRGPLRNGVVVAAVVFLLAFQEFELASLFYGIASWTVTVFDAQAGGSRLDHTLALVAAPVVLELVVVTAAVVTFARTRGAGPAPVAPAPASRLGASCIVAAAAATAVVPALGLLPALTSVREQWGLLVDVRHSVVFGVAAMVCAGVLAATCRPALLLALCVPGLAGTLTLGLLVQALFQTRLLAPVYDTPLPLLLAWTAWLLPLALLLRLAGERLHDRRAVHLAGLLGAAATAAPRRTGRDLLFRLRGLPVAVGGAVLFLVAFFEVVAGDLLAPGGMTPAAPRLYNLLHYGRSPGLAAMVALMALAAVLCVGGGLLLCRAGYLGRTAFRRAG